MGLSPPIPCLSIVFLEGGANQITVALGLPLQSSCACYTALNG